LNPLDVCVTVLTELESFTGTGHCSYPQLFPHTFYPSPSRSQDSVPVATPLPHNYITSLLTPVTNITNIPSRSSLRASSNGDLFRPRTERRIGDRAVSVAAPRAWNHTHNFSHLLKRQHSYTQKNESENLTNQQHETLKRYLAQSAQ